jgi:hypothetical protein
MYDDCFLPGMQREISESAADATLDPNYDVLRNGMDRPVNGEDNGVYVNKGEVIEYAFAKATYISEVRIVFDSDLNRKLLGILPQRNMPCNRPKDMDDVALPESLVKTYRIEAEDIDGRKIIIAENDNCTRRLVKHAVDAEVVKLRLIPLDTWGAELCHIFSYDFK